MAMRCVHMPPRDMLRAPDEWLSGYLVRIVVPPPAAAAWRALPAAAPCLAARLAALAPWVQTARDSGREARVADGVVASSTRPTTPADTAPVGTAPVDTAADEEDARRQRAEAQREARCEARREAARETARAALVDVAPWSKPDFAYARATLLAAHWHNFAAAPDLAPPGTLPPADAAALTTGLAAANATNRHLLSPSDIAALRHLLRGATLYCSASLLPYIPLPHAGAHGSAHAGAHGGAPSGPAGPAQPRALAPEWRAWLACTCAACDGCVAGVVHANPQWDELADAVAGDLAAALAAPRGPLTPYGLAWSAAERTVDACAEQLRTVAAAMPRLVELPRMAIKTNVIAAASAIADAVSDVDAHTRVALNKSRSDTLGSNTLASDTSPPDKMAAALAEAAQRSDATLAAAVTRALTLVFGDAAATHATCAAVLPPTHTALADTLGVDTISGDAASGDAASGDAASGNVVWCGTRGVTRTQAAAALLLAFGRSRRGDREGDAVRAVVLDWVKRVPLERGGATAAAAVAGGAGASAAAAAAAAVSVEA